MKDLTWSPAEKIIARRAFDLALKKELEVVMSKVRQMAGEIQRPADLWTLEQYLSECRKEIDDKYDYRYSQLPLIFGRLIREGWLTEEDLTGLGAGKMDYIRTIARI
jgi:hypothetical protein